jgi:hypothetical protein
MRATMGHLQRIAEELKRTGTYSTLENAPTHSEMNLMMSKERR